MVTVITATDRTKFVAGVSAFMADQVVSVVPAAVIRIVPIFKVVVQKHAR